jgi:hypothetical protein
VLSHWSGIEGESSVQVHADDGERLQLCPSECSKSIFGSGMMPSAFSVMLVAVVLCTQTLLAACGLRCEMHVSVPHTDGAQHAKASSSEHGDSEAVPGMGDCHRGTPGRSTNASGQALEQSCLNQHCGHGDLQVVISSSDRLDPSTAQAHFQSTSLWIQSVTPGGVSTSPGPSDGSPGRTSPHSVLSILNIRV